MRLRERTLERRFLLVVVVALLFVIRERRGDRILQRRAAGQAVGPGYDTAVADVARDYESWVSR